MAKFINAKNTVMSLSTEHTNISFQQALGLVKDLIGNAGYEATAKDLFELINGGRSGVYEKLVFEIKGESPISHFAVQKLGPVYTIIMAKANKAEYFTQRAKMLINLIEEYKPSPETIRLDTMKGKNLVELKSAIDKAVKVRGTKATVAGVLKQLHPNLKMKAGSYMVCTPSFKVAFNCVLGCVLVELEDANGFKRTVSTAAELRSILG